ncbi:MAG: Vitamin B12 dependent methionine synthase activation subunit [Clostridia bacterium]|nr:Vitamin B12 dependent methionine synthase activation subunit [Clostridia bacterium]
MIETKEVLRYLRTNSGVKDEELLQRIARCTEKAYQTIRPKTIYEFFDCTTDAGGALIGGVRFESKRLAANLAGCKQVVAFAATLGTQADTLLRTAKAEGAAQLMIYQAVLAAMVEEVCDNLEAQIKETHHVKLRQRYSPGYFDLALESQKDFFDLMDITKRIGVTLSDTMLMIPSKSVTAFIGVEYED